MPVAQKEKRWLSFLSTPGRAALVIVDMQNCFVAGSPVAAPLGTQVAGRLNQLAAAVVA